MYPLFCAISLVPQQITTTFGWRLITSSWKRTSICDDTCPLMPRPTKLLSAKNAGTVSAQQSVMEFPMNTTAGCFDMDLLWVQ